MQRVIHAQKSLGPALSLIVFFIISVTLSIYYHIPPKAQPATAPPESFSSMRAMEHLSVIARQSRPAGSAENAAVRRYLAEQIEKLGLSPVLQKEDIHWQAGRVATVNNIMTRIPGKNSSGAILLMAHHDSVPFGPGASDDGAGIVTLLETMRALTTIPQLDNDVIFLFTDGEEARRAGGKGTRGAWAFAEKHPWAKDVRLAFNFDCRGTSGPSYLYECSPQNGWLIQNLSRAQCTPVATSFMYEIYHSMPLDSDYTRFRNAEIPGLNFAFIKGLERYHTARDTLENINTDSLQHHGNYALQLTRHFGNLSLSKVTAPDRVYFNWLGYHIAHYPVRWVLPTTFFIALVLLLTLVTGIRKKHLQLRAIGRGFILYLLFLLTATGAIALISFLSYQIHGIYVLYSSASLTLGCIILSLSAFLLFQRWCTKRVSSDNLHMAVLILWLFLLVLSSIKIPGASYLFAWPLLFVLIYKYARFQFLTSNNESSSPLLSLLSAVVMLPGLLLFPGILYGVYMGVTIIFAAALIAGLMLLCGLLWPQFNILNTSTVKYLPIPGVLIAVACFAIGIFGLRIDEAHPRLNCLSYAVNADTDEAFWLSSDTEIDPWLRQFFPAGSQLMPLDTFLPEATGKYHKAPAVPVSLTPPKIEILQDETRAEKRYLHLKVTSPRKAPTVVLNALSDIPVYNATFNGISLQDYDGRWFLSDGIFPVDEGIELTLELPAHTPLKLRVIDHSYGLPTPAKGPKPIRPPYLIPKTNTPDFNLDPLKSDETIVAKTYTL